MSGEPGEGLPTTQQEPQPTKTQADQGARDEMERIIEQLQAGPKQDAKDLPPYDRAVLNLETINSWIESNPNLKRYLSKVYPSKYEEALTIQDVSPISRIMNFGGHPWGTLGISDDGVRFWTSGTEESWHWGRLGSLYPLRGDMGIVVNNLAQLDPLRVAKKILIEIKLDSNSPKLK